MIPLAIRRPFRQPLSAKRTPPLLMLMALAALCLSACRGDTVRLGYKPSGKELASAELHPDRLADYLSRAALATQGIVRDAGQAIRSGGAYRQNVTDQRQRRTLATIYVDRENNLHVTTMRDETCPDCDGSGTRNVSMPAAQRIGGIQWRCLTCDGDKVLARKVIDRKYPLRPDDYLDVAAARAAFDDFIYGDAPPDTERHVAAVHSSDPRERLAALVWLDQYWIREGVSWQKYRPLLDKARREEADERKNAMAWLLWAGRDIPGQEERAHYLIVADMRTGRVTRKGFTR